MKVFDRVIRIVICLRHRQQKSPFDAGIADRLSPTQTTTNSSTPTLIQRLKLYTRGQKTIALFYQLFLYIGYADCDMGCYRLAYACKPYMQGCSPKK